MTTSASGPVFAPDMRAAFSAAYPETPHLLRHALPDHPLMELGALSELGESLPATSFE